MLVEGGNFDLLSKPHIVGELHPDVIGCGFVEDLPDMNDHISLSSALQGSVRFSPVVKVPCSSDAPCEVALDILDCLDV